MDDNATARTLRDSVRLALLKLAKAEDALAASIAAGTPYWASCPPAVLGHYAAAAALRDYAEMLEHAS